MYTITRDNAQDRRSILTFYYSNCLLFNLYLDNWLSTVYAGKGAFTSTESCGNRKYGAFSESEEKTYSADK